LTIKKNAEKNEDKSLGKSVKAQILDPQENADKNESKSLGKSVKAQSLDPQ
jgi:hypothetical protein